jgi:hypothetical protein
MRNDKIEQCVEAICNRGCQSVRDDIALLEQGKVVPETEGFSVEEGDQVLVELKNIMAVYGDSCRI